MENEPSNNKTPLAADLEVEARLTKALARLPNTPVASNFTVRVMQAIELEASRPSHKWSWDWHALLPRIAVAAAVVLFAGLTLQHYETAARRGALVKDVELVAEAQPLPSVDALKNFDVIQRMSHLHADDELLALMQ